MSPEDLAAIDKKNKRLAMTVFIVVMLMVGLSFAAVPLYDVFCRVTGYGGTTQVSDQAPDQILDRKVIVKFTTNVSPNLDWSFVPDLNQVEVQIGQMALMSYNVENHSSEPVAGTAVYNVSPAKAGKYFHKTQCFCFGEQTVNAGAKVNLPVVFYLDPSIADDRSMDDIRVITLSYTYYPTDSYELGDAIEDFQDAQAKPIHDVGTFDDYLFDYGFIK